MTETINKNTSDIDSSNERSMQQNLKIRNSVYTQKM